MFSGLRRAVSGARLGVLGRSKSAVAIHITGPWQDAGDSDCGSGLLDLVSSGRVVPKLSNPMNAPPGRPFGAPMMNADALPPDASIFSALEMAKMVPPQTPASRMRRVAYRSRLSRRTCGRWSSALRCSYR